MVEVSANTGSRIFSEVGSGFKRFSYDGLIGKITKYAGEAKDMFVNDLGCNRGGVWANIGSRLKVTGGFLRQTFFSPYDDTVKSKWLAQNTTTCAMGKALPDLIKGIRLGAVVGVTLTGFRFGLSKLHSAWQIVHDTNPTAAREGILVNLAMGTLALAASGAALTAMIASPFVTAGTGMYAFTAAVKSCAPILSTAMCAAVGINEVGKFCTNNSVFTNLFNLGGVNSMKNPARLYLPPTSDLWNWLTIKADDKILYPLTGIMRRPIGHEDAINKSRILMTKEQARAIAAG